MRCHSDVMVPWVGKVDTRLLQTSTGIKGRGKTYARRQNLNLMTAVAPCSALREPHTRGFWLKGDEAEVEERAGQESGF